MAIAKVLFVPTVRDSKWVAEKIPWWSPSEVMVCGRRMIDYALESALNFGVKFAEIRDWGWTERLAKEYADGATRPLPLVYVKGQGEMPRGLNDLEKTNGAIDAAVPDGLAVVWGLCLSSHKESGTRYRPATPEECENTPMGFYARVGGRWMRMLPSGAALTGVKAWCRVAFTVLHNPELFTLPCYSAEKGVYLGRNVAIEHGAQIKPSVLLNDNSWLARNVTIDGDAIVGRGSFIGEGTHMKRTIVGVNTYIGSALDLENKVVIGRRIIDAETGEWTDMEEPGIARYIGGGLFAWVRGVWHFLRGHSHGRTK